MFTGKGFTSKHRMRHAAAGCMLLPSCQQVTTPEPRHRFRPPAEHRSRTCSTVRCAIAGVAAVSLWRCNAAALLSAAEIGCSSCPANRLPCSRMLPATSTLPFLPPGFRGSRGSRSGTLCGCAKWNCWWRASRNLCRPGLTRLLGLRMGPVRSFEVSAALQQIQNN